MAIELGTAYISILPSTSKFGPALSRGISRDVSSAGTSAGKTMGGSFSSALGKAAKVGGLALGAAVSYGAVKFTKDAIGLEATFGRTMNQIKATIDVPKAGLRDLSDLAMKLGADTVFSANDASQAMLELARGGMTAATIKGGALKGTLTLAAAGGLSMSDAANTAVKAMGAFNLKGKDMGSIAAALAGGANASASSVGDLSQALAQGGLAANSVGFSVQETTGILAAFSNKGLEGADAGTSLKTMLDRLQPATEAQAGAFEDLGVYSKKTGSAFVKSNGEFKSATQIAELLRKGTENMTAAQRKQAITLAFGSDAQRAANILATEGAAGLKPLIKATSDQGAAQKQAAANMKGTAGALEMMHGSIETASLAWGKALKPITMFGAHLITEIANGAVPIIQDFGGLLRRNLANIDLSGIGKSLKKVDLKGIFTSIRDAVKGIDFKSMGSGIRSIGDSIKGADWGALKDGIGKGASDTISVFSVAIGFAADHIGTLAKAMPFLITGFIAYKAAQATANVVALAHLPLQAAQIIGNFSLASSNRALAAQMAIANGVEKVGLITRIRSTVATFASTVAGKAAAAASKVWAGAQWLLNAALSANPLALIVIAIAALVAGLVIAYKKSDTFREIVDKAWATIKEAVHDAWENVIKPALEELGKFITDNLIPVITWLWKKVIKPYFKLIGAGIKFYWEKVIKPAFQALWHFIKDDLIPVITWLWKKVVKPYFKLIGEGIKFYWEKVIKPALKALWGFINDDLIPVIKWLWKNVVKPIFRFIGDTISKVWNDVIKPVFTALKDFITEKLVPGFRKGVEKIAEFWNDLKSATSKPVEFIVNTVYDKGIRPTLNHIPGVDLPHAHFDGFASGGWTGPGSKYQPAGIVHADEYVINKKSRRAVEGDFPGLLDTLNGYADGGRVGANPSRAVTVDGKQISAIAAAQLGLAEKISGTNFYVMQGGFGGSHIAASGTSHNYPGVMDVGPASIALEKVMRQVGFAAWARNIAGRSSVGSGAHIHAVSLLDPGDAGSPQVYGSWANHGNGLSGYNNDPAPHYAWIEGLREQLGDASLSALGGGGGTSFWDRLNPAHLLSLLNPAHWLSELHDMGPMGDLLGKGVKSVVGTAKDWLLDHLNPFGGGGGGGPSGSVFSTVASVANAYGWGDKGGGPEWSALQSLISAESSWNPTAQNPSSTAYGLFQFLDDTWATVGGTKTSDPLLQTRYGLKYIKQKYGDPLNAWATWQSNSPHSYDSGGFLPKGLSLAYNGTTGLEHKAVFTRDQWKSLQRIADSRPAAVPAPQGPRRMTLQVGEREFTGFVTELAEDAINGDRAFHNTTRRMRG